MKNEKGISLITLVITIVVVIILAAAVILSLGNNNPINSARVANVTENKDLIESAILAYTGNIQAKTLGALSIEEILTGNDYGIVGESSAINNEEEKIYIIDKEKFEERMDSLPLTPTSTGAWYIDGEGHVYLMYENIKDVPSFMKNKENKIDDASLNSFVLVKGSAKVVAKKPDRYYGATVTNYSANGIDEWKIFHSDGENIYLITSEYIPVEKIPKTPGNYTLDNDNETLKKAATLRGALNDSAYENGSQSIAKNNPARKWLALYLDKYSSSENNMRAVAYMLDTTVWNVYKNSIAEYAIGGPTIEMLLDSFNNRNNTDYKARVVSNAGYEVSKDGGQNWEYECVGFLNEDETSLYLPKEISALAMWLSSPSAYYDDEYGFGFGCLLSVLCTGTLRRAPYAFQHLGFRPVVCLKTDVLVTKNDDGSVTLK